MAAIVYIHSAISSYIIYSMVDVGRWLFHQFVRLTRKLLIVFTHLFSMCMTFQQQNNNANRVLIYLFSRRGDLNFNMRRALNRSGLDSDEDMESPVEVPAEAPVEEPAAE